MQPMVPPDTGDTAEIDWQAFIAACTLENLSAKRTLFRDFSAKLLRETRPPESDICELTIVLEEENLGIVLAVPPGVVTVVCAAAVPAVNRKRIAICRNNNRTSSLCGIRSATNRTTETSNFNRNLLPLRKRPASYTQSHQTGLSRRVETIVIQGLLFTAIVPPESN